MLTTILYYVGYIAITGKFIYDFNRGELEIECREQLLCMFLALTIWPLLLTFILLDPLREELWKAFQAYRALPTLEEATMKQVVENL